MRHFYLTEKQFDFLMKEGDCYLDTTDDGTNAPIDSIKYNGSEVTASPAYSDNAVTTDKVMHSRVSGHPWLRRSYGMNEELDDEKAFLDKKAQRYLSQMDGKMANNISSEMKKNGSRLNTTEVRLNRLKQQKNNDPLTFAKNGGEATVRALETIKKRQRTAAKKHSGITPRYNASLANTNNIEAGNFSKENNDGVIYDFRKD